MSAPELKIEEFNSKNIFCSHFVAIQTFSMVIFSAASTTCIWPETAITALGFTYTHTTITTIGVSLTLEEQAVCVVG